MSDEEYERITADAFRRLSQSMPKRAAWEMAHDDHVAKGHLLRDLVTRAVDDRREKRALTRAIGLAFELAAVVNFYANEGSGGSESVMNDMEGDVDAVDPDDVQARLTSDLDAMLGLLGRRWQVERRFPGYGWRLEELCRTVLAELAVLRTTRDVFPISSTHGDK